MPRRAISDSGLLGKSGFYSENSRSSQAAFSLNVSNDDQLIVFDPILPFLYDK